MAEKKPAKEAAVEKKAAERLAAPKEQTGTMEQTKTNVPTEKAARHPAAAKEEKTQTEKKDSMAEKPAGGKKEKATETEQLSTSQKEVKTAAVKKWKGKDWFSIVAPPLFEGKLLAETPATDPASLLGRRIETNAADLTGQANKYHMKLTFRISGLDGKQASTVFDGFGVIRDYIFRYVRKNSLKLSIFTPVETKDGWKLQVSTVAILNKNTDTMLGRKIRYLMDGMLVEAATKETLDQFIKAVISGGLQKSMRMAGTKIYPVRFCEVEKIEVLGEPAKTKALKETKDAEDTALKEAEPAEAAETALKEAEPAEAEPAAPELAELKAG